jgi:hypothetical protein
VSDEAPQMRTLTIDGVTWLRADDVYAALQGLLQASWKVDYRPW